MKTPNIRPFFRVLALGLCLSVVSGCGKGGFTVLSSSSDSASKTGSGTGPGGVGSDFESLDYKGEVALGPSIGTTVVSLDKTNGALILVVPLQVNPFIEIANGPVPSLAGAKFETYKDSKGKSYFALSVPLRYVLKGASFLPPGRLPNGNPLPQIPSGELPSVAVAIPGKNNVKFHVYLGVNVVGVFVSSPYDPFLALQFPIRNGLTDIGYIHSVPASGEFQGGFFLTTTLPNAVSAILDDHFRF